MTIPHKISDEVKKDIVEQVAERIEKSNEKFRNTLILDKIEKN